MQKKILVLLVVASCLGCLSAATVGVDPATSIVTSGSPLTLDIDIADVTDLYAYQFDLNFTPGILTATSITTGGFLDTDFLSGSIDNITGNISFIAESLAGPVPGISGSGTLATIHFLSLARGTSPITPSNIILLDSTLAEITTTISRGSVTITAIPEPGSVFLMAAGLLALRLMRRSLLE